MKYARRVWLFGNGERLYMRLAGGEIYCKGQAKYSMALIDNKKFWSLAYRITKLGAFLYHYDFRVDVGGP